MSTRAFRLKNTAAALLSGIGDLDDWSGGILSYIGCR